MAAAGAAADCHPKAKVSPRRRWGAWARGHRSPAAVCPPSVSGQDGRPLCPGDDFTRVAADGRRPSAPTSPRRDCSGRGAGRRGLRCCPASRSGFARLDRHPSRATSEVGVAIWIAANLNQTLKFERACVKGSGGDLKQGAKSFSVRKVSRGGCDRRVRSFPSISVCIGLSRSESPWLRKMSMGLGSSGGSTRMLARARDVGSFDNESESKVETIYDASRASPTQPPGPATLHRAHGRWSLRFDFRGLHRRQAAHAPVREAIRRARTSRRRLPLAGTARKLPF